MNTSIKLAGLFASMALIAGCAAEVGVADDTGEPVSQQEEAVVTGGVRIRTGKCNSDGMMIENGVVYWLGVPVGNDVTGISSAVSPNGPICHNTRVWQDAANYMCNMNGGGTRNQSIAEFDEYVDGALIQHPAAEGHNGLYFAYVDMKPVCDIPNHLDYPLDRVECCKTTPIPTPAPTPQ
jgi:hypothetical protein